MKEILIGITIGVALMFGATRIESQSVEAEKTCIVLASKLTEQVWQDLEFVYNDTILFKPATQEYGLVVTENDRTVIGYADNAEGLMMNLPECLTS